MLSPIRSMTLAAAVVLFAMASAWSQDIASATRAKT